MNGPGTLAVVATPLGDVRDLSPRAAEALRTADLIVAEDTRSARRLLAEIGAEKKTILSCFDANEAARAAEVAERLGRTRSRSSPRPARRSSPTPATGS